MSDTGALYIEGFIGITMRLRRNRASKSYSNETCFRYSILEITL